MALGTPCVATPVGGIAEALEHGSAGLLVAERDPAGLADALERLLADREVAVRLARAARARVEERFDVDCNAAEMRRMLWMPSTGHGGRHLSVPRPHETSPGGLPAGRRAEGRGGPSARRGPMIGEAAA
jgi:Glycosyl transferases group 1